MLVSRHSDAIPALTLPNVTVLPPCVPPNPLPVIVTAVPTAPLVPPLVVTVIFDTPSPAPVPMVNVAAICVPLSTVTPLTPIPGLPAVTVVPAHRRHHLVRVPAP